MKFKSVILIIIAVLVTIVATQNMQAVNVKLLFWDGSLSLILLIVMDFFIGFFAGFIIFKVKSRKKNENSNS